MAKNVTSKSYTLVVEADGFYRTRPPSDTSAPTLNGGLTVFGVTQTSYSVSFEDATDAQSGVASYEVQRSTSPSFTSPQTVTLGYSALGTNTVLFQNLAVGTHYTRYRATDAAGNVSAWSAAVTTTIAIVNSSRKWNPGFYMAIKRGESKDDATMQTKRFGFYDQVANNPKVKGFYIYARWRDLEPTQGDYSSGFAYIQAELDKCRAIGKKLIIRFECQYYGSPVAGPTAPSVFPSWVTQGTHWQTSTTGAVARWWATSNGSTAFIDKWIALIQAYGARFDSDPALELILLQGETALGTVQNETVVTSSSAIQNNYVKLATAAAAAWPTTNVCFGLNFFGTTSTCDGLVKSMQSAAPTVGFGCADIYPSYDSVASRSGSLPAPPTAYSILTGSAGSPVVDYRGKIPICYMAESSELGNGPIGGTGWTAAQIVSTGNGTLRNTHFPIIRMAEFSNANIDQNTQYWDPNGNQGASPSTCILAQINSTTFLGTGFPSSY